MSANPDRFVLGAADLPGWRDVAATRRTSRASFDDFGWTDSRSFDIQQGMVNANLLSKPMRKLLAAALLCFAVVVSQFAHADVPPSLHAPAAVQASAVDADVGHSHAAPGDEEPDTQHQHEKAVDGKCASHCPSIFVATSGGVVADILSRDTKAPLLASAMSDSIVAGPKKPPRS
ncbi:MAG: hypothetical protein ABJF07_06885 [Nisaea sp.]